MEHKLDRDRKLADYIYDDLGPEELVEFEDEISRDPRLSESYRFNMQVRDYLQAKVQLEDMRSDPQLEHAEKLADIAFSFQSSPAQRQEIHPAGNQGKHIRNLALATAVAASVIVLISLGIIPGSGDQDRLFERFYEPIEASDYTRRGQLNELYQDVAKGISLYMEGNYNQSIGLFNGLDSNPSIRPEVELFTGLSYMGLGQFQQAQSILQMTVEDNTRYLPEALWYLSLCCLKEHEFENAMAFLVQLESYDGMYKEDAQALLKKLRRLR